jgi:hypothetical protein
MSERIIKRKSGVRLTWTEEEVDFVFKLLLDGKSAGVIAKTMNDLGMRSDCAPVTRNAIVGIWNRDQERKRKCQRKVSGKKEVIPNPSYQTLAERNKKRITLPILKKIEKQIIPDDGITFEELKNNSCRFIYGEMQTQDIRYCGHPVDFNKGRSFCTMHYHVCYIPARKS